MLVLLGLPINVRALHQACRVEIPMTLKQTVSVDIQCKVEKIANVSADPEAE